MTIAEDVLLQRLQPVLTSYETAEDYICLDGTRQSILSRTETWIKQPNSSPEHLFWVFGPAGSGKSAFANTISRRLNVGNEVDLTFCRCERGDPVLSDPVKLLESIAYRIACKHEGYRDRLLKALPKNDRSPTAFHSFRKRYKQLLGDLLPNVAQPSRPILLVIDGLDACCHPPYLHEPAVCILELAEAVPWIKLLVTSIHEPEQYITRTLSKDDTCVIDINEEGASARDNRLFIRTRLAKLNLATHFDRVYEHVQLARGQFLLCWTMFQYLGTSRNPRRDLEKLLSEMAERSEEEQLYHLYDCILDHAAQNDKYTQHVVLGIIYVSSAKRPLSPEAISSFLQHDCRIVYEDPRSTLALTQSLRSVLFEQTDPRVPLRVRHYSFLQYLGKKLDSGFLVKLSEIHELMAIGCLKTLQRELRFNVCRLEHSYHLNKDVPDLSKRIQEYISEALQYSSLFWLDHVSQSDVTKHFRSISAVVVSPGILHWLEVLSWLDALVEGMAILRKGTIFFKVRHLM